MICPVGSGRRRNKTDVKELLALARGEID